MDVADDDDDALVLSLKANLRLKCAADDSLNSLSSRVSSWLLSSSLSFDSDLHHHFLSIR